MTRARSTDARLRAMTEPRAPASPGGRGRVGGADRVRGAPSVDEALASPGRLRRVGFSLRRARRLRRSLPAFCPAAGALTPPLSRSGERGGSRQSLHRFPGRMQRKRKRPGTQRKTPPRSGAKPISQRSPFGEVCVATLSPTLGVLLAGRAGAADGGRRQAAQGDYRPDDPRAGDRASRAAMRGPDPQCQRRPGALRRHRADGRRGRRAGLCRTARRHPRRARLGRPQPPRPRIGRERRGPTRRSCRAISSRVSTPPAKPPACRSPAPSRAARRIR